ncbi:hypothetical protein JL722_5670 [Aureococcus anophagefferens]|nr:hypothetical protein JL722_5670 [Aureococcus anophagefferens]
MAKGKKFRAAKDKLAKKEAKRQAAAQARNVEQVPTSMFFAHNDALGPPFHVLIDTNFINFSIKNKIDVVKGMTDCLLAKCIPVVLDSVMAELEKLGSKYRVALRLAKDPRFMRMASYLKKGTTRTTTSPSTRPPARKYTIERMPEAYGLMPKTKRARPRPRSVDAFRPGDDAFET